MGINHVMLRGNHKDDIFHCDDDCRQFLLCLQHAVDERAKVFAYCLMTNHIHLLIEEAGESVSMIVKRLTVAYASYYNKHYDKQGHLFEDRFKSEPVDDNGYFLTLLRYIHQNPVEAGIVGQAADYRWSSWHDYAQETHQSSIISGTFPQMFGGMTWTEMRQQVFAANGDMNTARILSRQEVKNDSEAMQCLQRLCQEQHITLEQIKQTPSAIRNQILRAAREQGVGMRQLSRLTGVSTSTIARLYI